MMKKRIPLLSFSLFIALTTGGCASNPIFGGDGTETARLTGQGCLVGALVGAGLGALISDNKAQGALLGGLLGGGIGCGVGYQAGQRTDDYANAQQAIDAEIALNEENATQLRSYNETLAQEIQSYQTKVSEIQTASMAETARQNQLQSTKKNVSSQLSQANKSLKSVDSALVVAKQRQTKYQVSAKPDESSNWENKIAALEQEKDILRDSIGELTALNANF